jgi:hypothetical protein
MHVVERHETPLDPWISALAEIRRDIGQQCAGLSDAQLNWRPRPGAWSVAQVLEHLVIANESYVIPIQNALGGVGRRTIWQHIPLLPRLYGALLVAAFSPGASVSIQAPELWRPPDGIIDRSVVARLDAQGERLGDLMRRCRDRELTSICVTRGAVRGLSPARRIPHHRRAPAPSRRAGRRDPARGRVPRSMTARRRAAR